MNFLSPERVSHSIQALLLFLNISKESQSIEVQEIEDIRSQCLDLLEGLAVGKIDATKGAITLNEIIEHMNHSLSAPYPSIPTDNLENFVKGEIVAFEHYLNQELKAHHITIQEEGPLFNASVTLWEQVGTRLSAQDSTAELCALVEKLNTLLPEDEQYPFPE